MHASKYVSIKTFDYGESKGSAKPPVSKQPKKKAKPDYARTLRVMYKNEDVTPKSLFTRSIYSDRYISTPTANFSLLQLSIQTSASAMSGLSSLSSTYDIRASQTISSLPRSMVSVAADLDQICVDRGSFSQLVAAQVISTPESKVHREMPATISVILIETPVIFLLEFPSITEEIGTEEGDLVEKDNEYYDYITIGRGRHRKTSHAEVQTISSLLKTRATAPDICHHEEHSTYVSNWDMYDTFEAFYHFGSDNEDARKYLAIEEEHDEVTEEYHNPFFSHHARGNSEAEMEKEMIDLLQNDKFQMCLTIMERVLANNNYNSEQKRFRGITDKDPFRQDIEFKYRLNLLWTFKNEETSAHPVTCLEWNPTNTDLLAVGYGKYFYTDKKNGLAFCWNIKNPTQPERKYYFDDPVTSLAFSNFEPNLLAVGLYNGSINLLDIGYKNVQLIFVSTHASPCHEPIWNISWFPPDDYNVNEEQIICASQDGRVIHFKNTKNKDLSYVPLMRVNRLEGKSKGIYHSKPCPAHQIPVSKHPAALVLTYHPLHKNIYYIGTDVGTIHKCSRNYLHQHVEVFVAHIGPIYALEFSPFCHKLFLSSGADWIIKIWASGIKEPLISLIKSKEAVEGAVWSPHDSTIVANIAGCDIYLWDFQRKTYLPSSIHQSPTNTRNTALKFSKTGTSLVVGDVQGDVHVFSLEDMPFPPFYQKDMLEQIVNKCLITRPKVAEELEKLKGIC